MQLRLDALHHIRLSYAWAFGLVLLAVQLLTGTSINYALLVLLFIIVTSLAVNNAKGLLTVGGFGIAMIGFKIVIVSQWAKVFLGQPGQSYLDYPILTIMVLAVGMISIYLAALSVHPSIYAARKIIKPVEDTEQLFRLALVAYIVGALSNLFIILTGYNQTTGDINVGGMIGLVRQIAFVYPLSIICATAYSIRRSKNTKSTGPLVYIAIATEVLFGILGTSKTQIFEPVFLYMLTCVAFKYSFNKKQLAVICASTMFMLSVLFPFAQAGRSFTRSKNPTENISLTVEFMKGHIFNKEGMEELEIFLDEYSFQKEQYLYYGKAMGLLDRFSLIEQNDELIRATIEQGFSGWQTITHGFKMLLPRALYPGKPIYNTANYLGHRIDIIGENDDVTQISMGFIAESFSSFGWIGVIVIPYLLMLSFLTVYNVLIGDIRNNVWSVFLIGIFQHNLVEATISSMVQYIIQFPLVLIVVYYALSFITRIMQQVIRK